jgi:DNA-binding transcriptional ArsR family regulator
MVKHLSAGSGALDAVFGALADPTRRAILARLARGEASVSELAAPFRMSLPAVSKHLAILGRAGLLARRKEGRVHRCRLAPGPMQEASEWIAGYRRFWEKQFDALAAFLAETNKEQDQRQKKEEPSWQAPSRAAKTRFTSVARSRPRARKSTAPGPKRKN